MRGVATWKRSLVVLVVALLLLAFSMGSAFAAGFALLEQSPSGIGNAFAGGAASAEDAATIFYNPAGLTRLPGSQFVTGAHLIIPSAKFKNEGSTHVLQSYPPYVPLLGGNGGDGGVTGLVPNMYVSKQINNKFWIGLGVNAPFGLSTKYDRNWVGRYHAVESAMLTMNINPSVAVRVTDKFSLGAGLNVQYLKAKLSNAIDFGTIDALPVIMGGFGGAFKLIPQMDDGFVELEGDSWGFGFNAGLLYEFAPTTRVGLAYRSRMTHKVEGEADFSGVPLGMIVATRGWFTDTDVRGSIVLPDSASLSFFHQFNSSFEIMADATWTNWSVLKELRFEFDNGQPDGITTEKWKDSYRYSAGATYRTGNWQLRGGAAYETTPIPSARYRTPRIPDNNRTWLTAGIGYRISDAFTANLGYAHIFVEDPKIKKTPTGEDAVRGGLKGTYDAHVDIVSAQIQWKF